MLGVCNHIWKNMVNISDENEKVLHNFAMKHNCVKESYHGKTFEGNDCSKLMAKIGEEDELLPNLTAIEHHIKAFKILNKLRIQMFGTPLIPQ